MPDEYTKPNFSELARITGLSRQTLSKRWKCGYLQPDRHNKRSSKYDSYENEIREKFLKTSNISAIFQYLSNKYPDDFNSYDGFKYYVISHDIRIHNVPAEAHVRYECDFGEQVQVDWKEDLKITAKNGEVIEFNLYVMVFSASRKIFMCIAFQKTQEEFFRCTVECLRRAGGCPKSLLTDNMSAICNQKTGELLEPVKRFLADAGFNIQRCKVKHPYTKGKVESSNRFVQWLAPYDGEIEDIGALYQKVRIIETQANASKNRTTGFQPDALFQADQKKLLPLPCNEVFDSWIKAKPVTARNTMLITYKNKEYSVPSCFINKQVVLVPCSDQLYIYSGLDVIRVYSLIENSKINYTESDYLEGLSGTMKNVSPGLIKERAVRNLEMIGRIGVNNDDQNNGK